MKRGAHTAALAIRLTGNHLAHAALSLRAVTWHQISKHCYNIRTFIYLQVEISIFALYAEKAQTTKPPLPSVYKCPQEVAMREKKRGTHDDTLSYKLLFSNFSS